MRKVLTLILVLLSVSVIWADKQEDNVYPGYDLAPGVIPGSGISAPTDEQWDLQYSYDNLEAQTGDNGLLGIAFDGTYLWVSGRGPETVPPQIYLFHPVTGRLLDQFDAGATSAWGIRDMCFDGSYMYGSWEEGLIKWDIETHQVIETIPIPAGMAFQRANAYDHSSNHFYCGNFSSTCYEQDREGNLIRSWEPYPLNAVTGMAWDFDAEDGPWLWVYDQVYPNSGGWVHQFDPSTLTYTGFYIDLRGPTGMGIAAGLDYCRDIDPVCSSMLSMLQGTPDSGAAWEMHGKNYVIVTITPINYPIQIPSGGGSFEFNLELNNTDPVALTFEVWTRALKPLGAGGYTGPLIGPFIVTLDSLASMDTLLEQSVPGRAPSGFYIYYAYTGYYPDSIWNMDYFAFTKLGDGDNYQFQDWCWGGEEVISGSAGTNIQETPAEFILNDLYPNPFNAETTIEFHLQQAGWVDMKVYNSLGQEAAVLLNEYLSAGKHQVTFSASALPSGIYFYSLEVNGCKQVKKALLVK